MRELKEELGIAAKPEQLQFVDTFRIQYEKEFHNKIFKDNEGLLFFYVYMGEVDIDKITVQEEELECRVVRSGRCLENAWYITRSSVFP